MMLKKLKTEIHKYSSLSNDYLDFTVLYRHGRSLKFRRGSLIEHAVIGNKLLLDRGA